MLSSVPNGWASELRDVKSCEDVLVDEPFTRELKGRGRLGTHRSAILARDVSVRALQLTHAAISTRLGAPVQT